VAERASRGGGKADGYPCGVGQYQTGHGRYGQGQPIRAISSVIYSSRQTVRSSLGKFREKRFATVGATPTSNPSSVWTWGLCCEEQAAERWKDICLQLWPFSTEVDTPSPNQTSSETAVARAQMRISTRSECAMQDSLTCYNSPVSADCEGPHCHGTRQLSFPRRPSSSNRCQT
jgi:hypothetical protein